MQALFCHLTPGKEEDKKNTTSSVGSRDQREHVEIDFTKDLGFQNLAESRTPPLRLCYAPSKVYIATYTKFRSQMTQDHPSPNNFSGAPTVKILPSFPDRTFIRQPQVVSYGTSRRHSCKLCCDP